MASNYLQSGSTHILVLDILLLRKVGVQAYPLKAPLQIFVLWSFHLASWTKVNVDGAFCVSLGPPGAGRVFQTSKGFVRGAFALPLQSYYAFKAELIAAISSIETAFKFSWFPLWHESDSMFMVKLLQSRSLTIL